MLLQYVYYMKQIKLKHLEKTNIRNKKDWDSHTRSSISSSICITTWVELATFLSKILLFLSFQRFHTVYIRAAFYQNWPSNNALEEQCGGQNVFGNTFTRKYQGYLTPHIHTLCPLQNKVTLV